MATIKKPQSKSHNQKATIKKPQSLAQSNRHNETPSTRKLMIQSTAWCSIEPDYFQ
jgi:hypothetical protein